MVVGQLANLLLAKKPIYAIIGTGRCGTNYAAELLTSAGIPFSHEGYFTSSGPLLRNRKRSYRACGDISWLAVPFLPDPDITVLHQTRHPLDVIRSFYNIGFFDRTHRLRHDRFVRFAQAYFEFNDEPLRSSMRWYLEWNRECELITEMRYRVEDMDRRLDQIANWLGVSLDTHLEPISKTTNARAKLVSDEIADIKGALEQYPEFPDLQELATRYGYEF